MDCLFPFLLCCIVLLMPAVFLLLHRRSHSSAAARLPPGPPGWPLFGNMFDLGPEPHKTIAGLKKAYGPIISLRIGSIKAVALLDAQSASELFKKHDAGFAERAITDVIRATGFDRASISLSPYGPYWRMMKRIVTVDLLSQRRIDEMGPVRRRCVDDMLRWIGREAGPRRPVHVAKFVFVALFNMIGNLVLSRDLAGLESDMASDFFEAMLEAIEWSGQPNVVDAFPWLWWADPQGLRRNVKRGLKKTLRIVGDFVAERLRERQSTGVEGIKRDFLEVLLEHQRNEDGEMGTISDHDINIIVLELFIAGTETTSSTIEWAMVELLKHPQAMTKVRDELRAVVGNKGDKFEEQHVDSLPYLQAVVKETLRLHPVVPLLVPRRAAQETIFMGHRIPRGAQVFVNTWAIGRDPECWDEPMSFRPERFLGSRVDYKGQNFELIPFGAGRRICAGIPLAHRMLHLVLGSLLHEFEWRVDGPDRVGLVDERERMGVAVRKLYQSTPSQTNPELSQQASHGEDQAQLRGRQRFEASHCRNRNRPTGGLSSRFSGDLVLWRHQMTAIAGAGFRAIAPDFRGYGLSEKPSEPEKTTFRDLVDDLVVMLDILNIPKVFLVGKDFGARVVHHFSLVHPDRILAVVTLGVPFLLVDSNSLQRHPLPNGFYMLRWQANYEPGRAEKDFGRFDVKTVVRNIYIMFTDSELPVASEDQEIMDLVDESTPLPAWFTEQDLQAYAELYEKSGFETALQVPYRGWLEDYGVDELQVEASSLLIMGENDYALKFGGLEDYIKSGAVKNYVPDLEVISVPQGTHFVQE
ncbi:cytochrome P450- family 76- subfamily G-polypeptide 1 [Striga hermonthica]|uniref:Cytochrome P450- family 76- subfamily G-polypeptide 1 n=1 Tax=Striga hermonthica TaxID=68872 RepID=A0A9N7R7L6_STRHE|nr:cytochrome P450- family 76- subfamily G-polypeptide 1 [Striga hermonthica]